MTVSTGLHRLVLFMLPGGTLLWAAFITWVVW